MRKMVERDFFQNNLTEHDKLNSVKIYKIYEKIKNT